ncbi:ubiquitin-related domain-containing protein [Xylariaceae sp. FL0594]|nr:ubiquitin-related domain-containing protein [Xylariaceae sp. FL0594]
MPSSEDLDNLNQMGFDKERAELALKKCGNLSEAVDWLDKTSDTPMEELLAEEEEAGLNIAEVEGQVAKSIVCTECGKKFRSDVEAQYHATKSGHVDFAQSTEEIAPLTEEEKKQRVAELKEKAKAKLAQKALADKEEQKRNEQIRLKATKESQKLKEELQRKEQIKEAARKRQEKIDDIEAKKRIKAKIEADKEERRRKAEEAKAAREGKAVPAVAVAATPAAAPAPARPTTDYSSARLRLQTSNGNVVKSLPADTTLFEVAQMLQSELGVAVTKFVQNFPRKEFEGHLDFGKSLKEAGLVPSAALIVI